MNVLGTAVELILGPVVLVGICIIPYLIKDAIVALWRRVRK